MTHANLLKDKSPWQFAGSVVLCVVFVLQSLYWGWNLGCFALADPDSCWLVATGRLIAEQGILAFQKDQFAWTLQAAAQPFVLYQWLSELAFATVYKCAGAIGLLQLTVIVTGLAFVCLPLWLARTRASRFLSFVFIVMLAFSAALYHMPLRPEIFSYLFLSVLLLGTSSIDTIPGSRQTLVFVLATAILFALWSNCHTGFVVGLAYLLCLLLVALWRRQLVKLSATVLAAALAGSMLQPYGTALYAYLPHLFFADINKLNVELQPLNGADIIGIDLWPLALLMAIVLLFAVLTFKNSAAKPGVIQVSQLLLCLMLFVCALSCRRLIPFFALGAEYFLLSALANSGPLCQRSKVVSAIWVALPVVAMLIGTWFAGTSLQLTLPSSTGGFTAPVGALDFIDSKRPAGNVYNDAQYGDLMILRSGQKAQVFIDTRFDLYSDKLTHDYYKIANARDNWLELLDEYKIDWLFVMHDYQAIKPLKTRGWQEIYRDPVSVILQRPKVIPGKND